MSHHRRLAVPSLLVPVLALTIAACSAGAGASTPPSGAPTAPGSGDPSTAPSGTPSGDAIEHPTGATDVILRYEEGGGFVMPGFLAASTPHFTLYGDGTIVFRNPATEMPPAQGSVFTFNPLRTATLSEEQVQEVLLAALGEGGLGVARADYPNDMVADASTAIFTVNAGGLQKQVSVYALGLDLQPGDPDGPARAAFVKLAERLANFDQGGTIPTDVFVPAAYRGVLFESPGAVAPDIKAWPWPDLTPADFKPDADPNGLQFPHRVMTPEEIEALAITGTEGGFQGMLITGPDGKTYTFSLRPLLPEESA